MAIPLFLVLLCPSSLNHHRAHRTLEHQPCLLSELEDRQWFKQGTDVEVVQIGGHRTLTTYRDSCATRRRPYHDSQDLHGDSTLSFGEGLLVSRPLSLKLFFLPACNNESSTASPNFSTPLDILSIGQERLGLKISSAAVKNHDNDEDSVSPTASPRRSKRITPPSRQGKPLTSVDEHGIIKKQSQQGRSLKSWTWEARYIRSSTQILADAQTTVYFLVNFPSKLQKRITDIIRSMEALAKNPLFMDTLIIDEVIAYYRDAIKSHRSQLLALNDDDSKGTEMSIKLEELAANWRTILQDVHGIRAHIHQLQDLVRSREGQSQARASSVSGRSSFNQHTRQKSSEVFGPQAAEILELQHSTCEFWTRCVTMYLERTTDRAKNSVQRNSASVSTLALSFLSTIFFSPDGLFLAITYWWWILATLIVPLTFIVMHLWFETLAKNTRLLRRRKTQQPQQLEDLVETEMD
ncbi:hypothetical protein M406DRAFT_325004 [Cryphonectria parasitica EP155]|uniref:Uncharacterized protein n=1 Tax=Cryphonectria parasitica (strain ATCC 38755 / EP155) TaxID=660469 RepID=A0A9P4YAV4_CRYP1|nr:uncharacterized protein M406DRAFT_325004 [Cryphonectria parasitica EP155]KAF3769497.1 hypothetical protein M406DRAFT_325004 [Cryphonectria parasitica EP155]